MKDKLDKNKELDFLNNLVIDYKDVSPYSKIKKNIIIDLITKSVLNPEMKNSLQMGCSNGYETEQLSKMFETLDVVDGSSVFIEKLKNKYEKTNVKMVLSLFEDMPKALNYKKYDYIFCNYVLEHVHDSVEIMKLMKELLSEKGSIFIVVPNGEALSRQIAKKIGFLKDLVELSKNDLDHGHRRVYTINHLENDISLAGLKIKQKSGVVFKILADFQLNELLDLKFLNESHILALQELANQENNLKFSDSYFVELIK